MKSLFLSLITFLAISSTHAQSAKKLADDNGYNEFKLGLTPDDFTDLRYDSKNGNSTYYYYTGSDMTPFGRRAYDLKLSFYKGHLSNMWWQFYPCGLPCFREMLKVMEKDYGPSTKIIIKLGEDESKYWEYEKYMLTIKFYDQEEGMVNIGLINTEVVDEYKNE
ncbi:hypothetical protein JYT74_00380 [Crocinitomix catalasitica]|nr:hypothetical protein [Crocinitomix catalasitica]